MTPLSRRFVGGAVSVGLCLVAPALSPVSAQGPAAGKGAWVVPRTPDGRPDFQGNWTNETQTPLERMGQPGPTLTDEQAAAIEQRAQQVEEFRDKASDPNRPPPSKGGEARSLAAPGTPSFIEQIAEIAGGKVGGYNGFWLDPGLKVIRIDGVARSSIVIDPPNGRIPPLTAAGQQRLAQLAARAKQFGSSITPRCGRSPIAASCRSGPTPGPDAAELLLQQQLQHRADEGPRAHHERDGARRAHDPPGSHRAPPVAHPPVDGRFDRRWDGDTLVVETTNIHPLQLEQTSILWAYRGASEKLKVTERFTRTGPDTILYRFTMEDPSTFTAPWTGELPFTRIDEEIYEYACHEGNYALSNILSGERAREREEAAKKKPQPRR